MAARRREPKPESSKFLTVPQILHLLKAPWRLGEARDYYLLSLAYYGALRASEVVSMQSRYIRISDKDMIIPTAKRKVRKHYGSFCEYTGRPLIAIPILFGEKVLAAAKAWGSDRQFMFQSPQKEGPISTRQFAYTFKRWAKVAGLSPDVSPHALRHTGISHVQDAVGDDMVLIRDFARHSNIAVTSIYLHSTPQKLNRARQRMKKLYG